jgi:hypothetical protein
MYYSQITIDIALNFFIYKKITNLKKIKVKISKYKCS